VALHPAESRCTARWHSQLAISACGMALGQVVSNVLSAGLVAGWLGLRAYEWYNYSSRQQVLVHCLQQTCAVA
jgi:hypothetical protein